MALCQWTTSSSEPEVIACLKRHRNAKGRGVEDWQQRRNTTVVHCATVAIDAGVTSPLIRWLRALSLCDLQRYSDAAGDFAAYDEAVLSTRPASEHLAAARCLARIGNDQSRHHAQRAVDLRDQEGDPQAYQDAVLVRDGIERIFAAKQDFAESRTRGNIHPSEWEVMSANMSQLQREANSALSSEWMLRDWCDASLRAGDFTVASRCCAQLDRIADLSPESRFVSSLASFLDDRLSDAKIRLETMGTALGTEAADLLSVIDQILSKNREDLKDQQEILAHLTSRRPVWERRVSKVWWNVMVAVMKTILRTRPLDENGMKRGLSVMSKHHRHHHSSREAHSMQFWALRESEAVLLEAKHEEIERERLLSEAEACSARLETAEASARAVASRLDRELEQLNQEASALRLTMHEGQQGQPDQVPVGQSGWTQRREDAAAHQQRNRGQSRRQAETWTTYSEPRRKDAHVWLPRFSTSMAGGPARYYIESEADAASHTNALKGRILGLDLEGMLGRPRDPGPVPTHMRTPLLQLCDGNTILIFQLDKIGSFPSGVKQLIESEDVYKVGVAIKNDLAYLRRDFRVNARAYVDLSDLAKWVAPSDWTTKRSRNEMIGLADLCRCYLGQHLQKSKVTRSSNWRGCLSYEQLAYACDDVFCSYKVGVHLNEHGSPGMGNIRRFAEGLPPEAAGEDEDGSDSDLGYRCIGAS